MSKEFIDLWPSATVRWGSDYLPPQEVEALICEYHPGFALALATKRPSVKLPEVDALHGDRLLRARPFGVIKQFESQTRWNQGGEEMTLLTIKCVVEDVKAGDMRPQRRSLPLMTVVHERAKPLVVAMIEAIHEHKTRLKGKEREKARLDSITEIPLTGQYEGDW